MKISSRSAVHVAQSLKPPLTYSNFTGQIFALNFTCNSYTMGFYPVRVDNPRALASGLSYVQVDKHGITIYTTYISVDLAHHAIFRAKVGKGGFKNCITRMVAS